MLPRITELWPIRRLSDHPHVNSLTCSRTIETEVENGKENVPVGGKALDNTNSSANTLLNAQRFMSGPRSSLLRARNMCENNLLYIYKHR